MWQHSSLCAFLFASVYTEINGILITGISVGSDDIVSACEPSSMAMAMVKAKAAAGRPAGVQTKRASQRHVAFARQQTLRLASFVVRRSSRLRQESPRFLSRRRPYGAHRSFNVIDTRNTQM